MTNKNLQVNNNITIEDYCSRLYPNFENIKQQFLKYFNNETNEINKDDFNDFIMNIQKDLDYITYYINANIFNHNEDNWNISNTYIWVTKCFYKINKIKTGYIIQLYNKNKLNLFCACCKKTLANLIKYNLQYTGAQKRKCENMISIEGNDNMQELEDLKDYLSEINTLHTYIRFKNVLNKNERSIFEVALFVIYRQLSNITREEIAIELNLSKRTIYRNIDSIKTKWIEYKKNNNIK